MSAASWDGWMGWSMASAGSLDVLCSIFGFMESSDAVSALGFEFQPYHKEDHVFIDKQGFNPSSQGKVVFSSGRPSAAS